MKLSRATRAGGAAAILYLIAALIFFVAHRYSVRTNPADSGESAIPLAMFALPWVMFIPDSWHYLPARSWS